MSIRKLFLLFVCALVLPVSIAAQAKKSAADQRLYEKAHKACSGPEYFNARPHINYARKWFRCVEEKINEKKGRGMR